MTMWMKLVAGWMFVEVIMTRGCNAVGFRMSVPCFRGVAFGFGVLSFYCYLLSMLLPAPHMSWHSELTCLHRGCIKYQRREPLGSVWLRCLLFPPLLNYAPTPIPSPYPAPAPAPTTCPYRFWRSVTLRRHPVFIARASARVCAYMRRRLSVCVAM